MKAGMVVILLLILPAAYAATLEGNVYDIELSKVEKAVITINTTPKQVFVAWQGSYSLEVPPGSYQLVAEEKVRNITYSKTTEQIDVVDPEGTYHLDFILFPELNGEEELPELELDILPETKEKEKPWLLWGGIALVVLGLFYLLLRKFRKEETKIETKTEQIPDELDELLAFIRRQGGRVTQKDIRKQFPSSEAKISLMISELEAKGKVEKIKKGRGNIIKTK